MKNKRAFVNSNIKNCFHRKDYFVNYKIIYNYFTEKIRFVYSTKGDHGEKI